jgi:hypothetical protein
MLDAVYPLRYSYGTVNDDENSGRKQAVLEQAGLLMHLFAASTARNEYGTPPGAV